jgi:hypothetical protein
MEVAHPSPTSKGPDMLPEEPIREHPNLPGDPYMSKDGGGGKKDRYKNLMVKRNSRKKPNNSSLIPNITKVTIFVPSFLEISLAVRAADLPIALHSQLHVAESTSQWSVQVFRNLLLQSYHD